MARKYEYNKNFFTNKGEEYYYYLGFISADGYINDGKIHLELNNKDRYILERFRDLISPDSPVVYHKKTNSSSFSVFSKELAGEFKSILNMISNKKSDEIRMPDIPYDMLKHYIRGIIDGDGCIDTTKGYRGDKVYIGPRLRILSNYNFLQEMLECIREQVPNKTKAVCKKGKENVYYITYNFSIAKAVLDWCYSDSTIHLERKYQKYLEVTR